MFSLLTLAVAIVAAVSVVAVTVNVLVYILIKEPVESWASKVKASDSFVLEGFMKLDIENENSVLASIVVPLAAEIVIKISLFNVLQVRDAASNVMPTHVGVVGAVMLVGTFI